MRKNGILILIIGCFLPFISNATYCWVQRSNVGTVSRYAAMGFSIGTKGYVACGYSGGGKNDLWEYDATTNIWTQKANYPGGNIWAGAGFAIGNKGYISIGTGGSNYPTDTYEYNPANNTWTSKASFPSSGRQDSWAFGIGNYGYIVGGWKPGYYSDTWRFDPANNSWTQLSAYGGGAKSGLRGFVIGNIAYAVGGLGSSTSGSNQIWAFDPATNSWTAKANLPGTGRHSACCFEMNGKGIVGGGFNGSTGFADFYEYTPATNTWIPITAYSLTRPLGYPVCFTIGANGYIATGQIGNASNSNQTWMLSTGITAAISYSNNACGDTYNFSANAPGASILTWDFGDGTTSTSASPTHQYLNPGPYTVTLTVSNGSCTTSVTQNLVVTASPNASFTYTIDTCNLSVTFQNNSQNAGSYIWHFGDGQSSSLNAPTHNYTSAGPFNVQLIATSSINPGCADTTLATISFGTGILSATATIQPDCNNGITISNFSTTATAYTWIWGNGTQNSGPVSYYQFSSSGNYTVQLALTKGNCLDTIDFPVTVGLSPTAAFSATSNCNLTVSINNQSTTGSTLMWDWGNGNSSNGPQTTYAYSQSGPYTITLIATQGICADTTSQIINVFEPVQSQFSLISDCSNGISITNLSQGGTSFSWNWGDGNSSSGLQSGYQYNLSGNYTITMIASNLNCNDTSQQNITVQTSPVAQISTQYNLCHDSITVWSIYPATSYSWFLDNTYQTSASSVFFSSMSPINPTLILISANGNCNDTDFISIQLAGIADASFTTSVSCNGEVAASPVISNLSSYLWDNGLGNNFTTEEFNYTFPDSGNYNIQLFVSNGHCVDSSNFNFTIGQLLNYSTNFSIDSCSRTITASVLPDSVSNVIWNFGDGITLYGNPIQHQFEYSQVFSNIVYIDTASNCGDTISFEIDLSHINHGTDAIIPNCFTPNNDTKNDSYKLNQEICDFLNIKIYNRWGQVVFESTDQYFMWDGKFSGTELPEGVYLLYIFTKTGQLTGTVSILR